MLNYPKSYNLACIYPNMENICQFVDVKCEHSGTKWL